MNAPATTGPREARVPVAKLPLRQVADVKTLLVNDQAKQQLSVVAAKHMNPERMMRLMANALRTTPKLGECSPLSLLGAMMQCASLGLEPNTVLGHAYLIPFERKEKNRSTGKWEVVETNVQLIIGYKGYIDLARRSGHITSIAAGIHYSDDVATGGLWDYQEGTEARLCHTPGDQQGEKQHAYAIAKFRDGGHAYVVLPWSKVMKIRDGSQGWQSAVRAAKSYNKPINSPWATHEDEMAQKTAIRALAKFLPLSTEFRDGLEADGGRADYASFAMNPVAGLDVRQPEYIDADYAGDEQVQDQGYDRETGEVHAVEDQRAGQMIMNREPEREREPARRQQRNTAPAADHTDKTPHEDRPQRQSQAKKDDGAVQKGMFESDMSDMLKRVDEQVLDNLQDGADLDETLDMFSVQIEMFKEQVPDELESMMDEWRAFVAERDGADQ